MSSLALWLLVSPFLLITVLIALTNFLRRQRTEKRWLWRLWCWIGGFEP